MKPAELIMRDNKHNHYPHHAFLYNLVVGDGIDNVDVAVARLLLALGFRSKLHGATYIKEAIKLWYDMPATARVVLSIDIYPQIATKLGSTAERVERSIRNAIHDCHHHGKLIWFNDLVQSDVVSAKYVPTNGEFLSSVVDWLRIQCRDNAKQMSFLRYIEN